LYSIKKNKKNGEFVIEIAESTPLYENSSQGFSIFHNALKKNVTIETENQINIRIKDAEGKTVKNEQLFQVLKSKVNTDELPPGEYFIDIKIGDKVSTKKIMVK